MNPFLNKKAAFGVVMCGMFCFFSEIPAASSPAEYNYSHRKRDCEVRVVTPNGIPCPMMQAGIGQLSNHFIFGGIIRSEAFDTLIEGYQEKFLNYFDVAVPEKEMNWGYVMNCAQKCDADFSKADFLVDWLIKRKVTVYGRTLFSNGREENIPEWTRNLEPAAFKQAMQERITGTIGRFKGKTAGWFLIDEACHNENGSLLTKGILETKSGDGDVFGWIMDEAGKTDSTAEFIIEDNGLITSDDLSAADSFINRVKPFKDKFQIIGVKAHFGPDMNKNSYESKINYIAEKLGKPVLLSEVDFSFDINQVPDKIEELMRTCFANPNVAGIILGSWHQSYMSQNNLTGYFIDSLNSETPAGERWREVRKEWKTDIPSYTDDSGKVIFNGFHGRYQVIMSCDIYEFYLEPGQDTQKVEIVYSHDAEEPETTVVHASSNNHLNTIEINIDGILTPVKLPANYNKNLVLNTYSLSGRLLSTAILNPSIRNHRIPLNSRGCRVFRIETADRKPLYSGKMAIQR